MKHLPIPKATPENLVFFGKRMKLRDSQTAVHLDSETDMAIVVWKEMMNIYAFHAQSKTKSLNDVVYKARLQWLTEKGVTAKGLIIYVGGMPTYRINQNKVGLRQGFYNAQVDAIESADSKQKLGAIKRRMKTVKSLYKPTDKYWDFYVSNMKMVHEAYVDKLASL